MDLAELNPFVRFVRKVGMSVAAFRLSRNYDCRLFFFEKMSGSIFIDGVEYKISNNDAVFLPPASCYRLLSKGDEAEIYALGMDLDARSRSREDDFTSVHAYTFDPLLVLGNDLPTEFSHPIIVNAPELRGKFERCYEELRLRSLYFRETASGVAKLILTEMLRRRSFSVCESGITNAVIDYIKQNYGDVTLGNDSIARRFDYHPYYLSRVMKQTTGKPLHKYITEYRVEVAKGLLVAEKYDIVTISKLCGFTSASYFTKVFRDECGLTPTAYRREYSEIV